MSQITLRLVERHNGRDDEDVRVVAKLAGQTLPTLQRCLVSIPIPSPCFFIRH
jgi:hypothetical protein